MVNLSAPSDMEIETETSAETEICNDSINLNTKESFSEGKKEVNSAVEKQSNRSDLRKEPEKTKDSCFNGEQKKGGMEPPELSVQPSMTKTCDIDIVQGSSVQRETKDDRNIEQESSCQHDQERINDKAVDEKEFLIREEIKENPDADKESSVEEIQNDIKDEGKNSEGVTNAVHI